MASLTPTEEKRDNMAEMEEARAIRNHNRFAASKKAEWELENAAGMKKVEETFESIEKWLSAF